VTAGDEGQDLDLAASEQPRDQALVAERRFNPERQQELVRTWVAFGVIATVIAETLILTFAFVVGAVAQSSLTTVTAAVITPMVGIAGTVLGFYFGTHRRGDSG
jgi:hypothetical protein